MVRLAVTRYLGLRLRRSRLGWIAPGLMVGLPIFLCLGGLVVAAIAGERDMQRVLAVAIGTSIAVEPFLSLGVAGYLGFWLFAAELERDELHAFRMATPSIAHVVLQGWLFAVAGALLLAAWLAALFVATIFSVDDSVEPLMAAGVALLLFPANVAGAGIGMLVSRFAQSENGAITAVALSLLVPIVVPLLAEANLEGSGLVVLVATPLLTLPSCLIAFRSLR